MKNKNLIQDLELLEKDLDAILIKIVHIWRDILNIVYDLKHDTKFTIGSVVKSSSL